jgi:hypothetical protein
VLGTAERRGNLPAIIENHWWDQHPILWKGRISSSYEAIFRTR